MSRFSILVVDDDPVIRGVVTRFLEGGGHGVTAAADGREALALFDGSSYDLVITDFKMGEMTGADLARRLRETRPEVPVCLMTAVESDVGEEDLSTFAAVLEKPFDKAQLDGVLAELFPAADLAGGRVRGAPRFAVDWRVDYLPLEAGALTAGSLAPRRGVLRNLSERGLAFVTDEGSAQGRFGAFLIYPPGCRSPSLMVGEIRWRKEHDGGTLAGTQRMFWGSPRERDLAMERAG
ncbi:MAG: response regulator [Acidobacteriota bacterium]|nr:response regulator [Acidobacteriota bacterium]MDH3524179.1 response regulator [Acidobacteriota bacterium]